MKAKKWTHGTIGTVSEATMRPEDLIPSFCSELRYLGHRSTELSRIEKDSQREGYYDTEESGYDLESLFDMLDEHALPYMYFGAHPGDGADYGFWISEGIEYDFDEMKINEDGEVYQYRSKVYDTVEELERSKYTGYALECNERGNLTLWQYKRGKRVSEVWAVV